MPLALTASRLTAARELRQHTRAHLAALVGVTPAAITMMEAGTFQPSPDLVERLSLALAVPRAYLVETAPITRPDESGIFYRSKARIPKKTKVRLQWLGAHRAEALEHLRDLLEVAPPPVDLPDLGALTPVEAAQELRRHLGMTEPGPIADMIDVLETLGVDVHALTDDQAEGISAYSYILDGRPVVVLNRQKEDAWRARFDAAHELGHLVRDDAPAGDARPQETAADQFAAEFLVPLAQWRKEAPRWNPNPHAYREHAAYWRVSIACLLRRTWDAGLLSDSQYKYAMMQYSALGWRCDEPRPAEAIHEEPQGTVEVLRIAAESGLSWSAAAAQLRYGDDLMNLLFAFEREQLRGQPMVELVRPHESPARGRVIAVPFGRR